MNAAKPCDSQTEFDSHLRSEETRRLLPLPIPANLLGVFGRNCERRTQARSPPPKRGEDGARAMKTRRRRSPDGEGSRTLVAHGDYAETPMVLLPPQPFV
jgi:hypothetical protein